MKQETCPRCGQNSDGPYETVGTRKYFLCSNCGIEWVTNQSTSILPETENNYKKPINVVEDKVAEELNEDEIEEDYWGEEEEDPEDPFVQAQYYANSAISTLLKKIIKKFDLYKLNSDSLIAVCQMYKVTSDFKKFSVNGYLNLSIKCTEGQGNFRFQEITIDSDGLRLTNGGFVTDEDNGFDSYSDEVYPTYDEDEVKDTVIVIDNFVEYFNDNLESENMELDGVDSGDGIEEI